MLRTIHSGFFINADKSDGKIKFLFFLLWPIGAFIYSLRCPQSRSSRLIFFLICVAFGLSIECKDDSFDMSRITDAFLLYRYADFEDLKNVVINFINGIGIRDLYEFFLYWLVNQISSNVHVFWMIAASIYAFFYLKSLSFILDDKKFTSCFIGFVIILMFTMPQPIFVVTGLRFWTAGWLAILCTLQIFLNRNYKYILVLLLTPFIHVVYWIYIVLIFMAFVVIYTRKVSEKILIVLFFISYPLSYLSMSYASDVINANFLPSSLQLVALSYTDENHIEEFNRQGTGWFWLKEVFDVVLNVFYLIMTCFIIKYRDSIVKAEDKNLFLFVLVVFSFANFTSIIPHLGLRFLGFVRILLPLLWLRIFGLDKYKWFICLYLVCASFYILKTRLLDHFAAVLNIDFLYNSFVIMIMDNIFF